VSLVTREGTLFTAGAEVHPSAMVADDAPLVTVPLAVIGSGDEDAELIKLFGEKLTVPKFIDYYDKAPHVSLFLFSFDDADPIGMDDI